MNVDASADEHRAGLDPIERWSEWANIGAGHAAGALAAILGTSVRMQVPRVVAGGTDRLPVDPAVGMDFDIQGGVAGRFAVLLGEDAATALRRALLGPEAPTDPTEVRSALSEVGNIVASHALSAIADLIGSAVLPSPPELYDDAAGESFAARCGDRAPRIENVLVDDGGVAIGVLVWFPEV